MWRSWLRRPKTSCLRHVLRYRQPDTRWQGRYLREASSPSPELCFSTTVYSAFEREMRESVAHTRGRPNRETNEARGEGSCTGPVEVNRGPLMTSGTLYRLGRPRISLRPLSSPSVPHHLYRGPKSRGRNFKSSPCTHRRLCTRPQNGRPNRETNEVGGGGSCTGPVEQNRGPHLTSVLLSQRLGCCTVYRSRPGPPSHFPPSVASSLSALASTEWPAQREI
jgi:hypothetical protein